MSTSLEFALDVSGTPGNATYFGMVCFDRLRKDAILDGLFRKEPRWMDVKGRQLRNVDLLNVVQYLNSNGVQMRVLRLTAHDWAFHKKTLQGKEEVVEKLSALVYYTLIRTVAIRGQRCSVVSCEENQLGSIRRVFFHCKKLARKDQVDLDLYQATDAINDCVKVADFIAAAGSRLSSEDVSSCGCYAELTCKNIKNGYYQRLFRKSLVASSPHRGAL